MFYLKLALAVVGALLMIVILLQNRGAGLSLTFGGNVTFQPTKRGPEKFLATSTVVLAVLFLVIALLIPFWEPLVLLYQTRFGA